MSDGSASPGPGAAPLLVAGLAFGLGALVAAPIAGIDIGGLGAQNRGQVTWFTLFAGAFLSGCLGWWLVVARRRRVSPRRGAVAGIVAGLGAYPIVLLLAGLLRPGAATAESIGERLLALAQLTALTVVTTGFAAACVMGLVGTALAVALRRLYPAAPPAPRRSLAHVLGSAALTLVGLLALAFAGLSLLPLGSLSGSRADPAATHAEALAAFAALRADEAGRDLNPRCASRLLTHGARTAQVVVLLHGFTNCPAQFDALAPELFALGYNVHVPLLPRHGEADRMTEALAALTAEELVASAGGALDLARGLGEEVIVVGLSGGGTMAAWLGQQRADTGSAVAMAPFLTPQPVPFWANRAATNLLLLLPNFMVPWDPQEPEGSSVMDHVYPRYATHALAQFMRLGEIVIAAAAREPPRASGLGLLLNEADLAVNNAAAWRLAEAWRRQGRDVDIEVLAAELGLIHDLIDPLQPEARTDLVYPVVLAMIARQSQQSAP